ncbi:MAG: type transport system permease protein [Gammaproteobacteria bacterium]|jgi:ABC-2 type transport system permease protein|nr:type transport system permease protein [Gammaproteobacteria bacterium]
MNKLLMDTYLLGKNELIVQVRNPLWLVFGLFQPVVYLLLFAPFLTGIAKTPGFPTGNAIQFFAPGLLILNALFNASFAGFGLIDKLRSGFLERIRVTPVSRLAIVLGLVLRNAVVLIVQSALLLLTALLFGLRVDPVGAAVVAILMTLIGITMASLSYTVAVLVKDEGTLAAITNFFTLPLVLLSGVMLPVAFAPASIRLIARFDPFTYAVDAARALLNGIPDPSIWQAFGLFSVLGIVALWSFIRSMREAVA